MAKKKYAIYGMYSFETTCDDSPRGSEGPDVSILVKLTHEQAMDMGMEFIADEPYTMDYDSCMDYIDRVRKKMVREKGYSEEESWQYQVIWSSNLIDDCKEYYRYHREPEYVIDGFYDFGTVADGARPSSCGSSGIHLQYEHEDVMEMGKYFHENDPYEMDFDYNFGLKEQLDEILAESMVETLREEWEEEQNQLEEEWYEENGEDSDEEFEREEEPDFYLMAYEQMGDMYHCWDGQFKQDCIDYYLKHKEEE